MLRNIILWTLIIFILATSHSFAQNDIIPNTLVIKFKDPQLRTSTLNRAEVLTSQQTFPFLRTPLSQIYTLSLVEGTDVIALANEFSIDANVEYAEPLYQHHISIDTPRLRELQPNDEFIDLQWALEKMQMFDAWEITQGDPNVVIGVIDTGMDMDHPDLEGNLWTNPFEIENGQDDDGNGLIDDIHGWDVVEGDNNPEATFGHGTLVGGIAAAHTNNNTGIAGVGWQCRIMPIRAGESTDIPYGYQAIVYAAYLGADIINCSWGRTGNYSHFEAEIIEDVASAGKVIVAAAGNESSENRQWPAAYDGVIAVGNSKEDDRRAANSNYGTWLDVHAPGSSIYTTAMGGGYASSGGTSLAAPQVSGLAALLKAYHPDWTAQQITEQIIVTADPIDDLHGDVFKGKLGSGRVNAYRALTETVSSIRVTAMLIDDIDNDGIIETNDLGQPLELILALQSLLTDVKDVTAVLSTNDNYTTLQQTTADFGDIDTNQIADNFSSPYQFTVSEEIPHHHLIDFNVDIYAEGDLITTDQISIRVKPSYRHHDNGNLIFSVSDRGVSGWGHVDGYTESIIGFRYPYQSLWDFGYSGSLVVGTNGDWVADGYGSNQSDPNAWQTTVDGALTMSLAEIASEIGLAVYGAQNSASGEKYQVTQTSFVWNSPDYRDFVIMRFQIENVGEQSLTGVHAGYLWDFDIPGDIYGYAQNAGGYESTFQMGYAYHTERDTLPYVGVQLLDTDIYNFRVINNAQDVYGQNDIRDEKLFEYMSTPGTNFLQTEPLDISVLMTAEPFDLAAGESKLITFAFLVGDDLNDLRTNAAATENALAFSQLVVSPSTHDYGTIALENNLVQAFILTNTSGENLTINDIYIGGTDTGDFTVVSGGDLEFLGPSQSATVQVRFAPQTAGRKSAFLVIQSGEGGMLEVPLMGIGLGENDPYLVLYTETLDFGSVRDKAAFDLPINNNGFGDLTVYEANIQGTNAADFRVVSDIPITISPNQTRTLQIEFAPQSTGQKTATVEIISNSFSSPDIATLTGIGIGGDYGGPYPNPFIVGEHEWIRFDNIDDETEIQIFALDGALVYELLPEETTGSVWEWNVTNENGEPLASGIYVYVISFANETKAGRFAIIR